MVTVFMVGLAAGAWWANRRLMWGGVALLRQGFGAQAEPRLDRNEDAEWRHSADSTGSRQAMPPYTRRLARLGLLIAALAVALPWLLRAPPALDSVTNSDLAGQGFLLLLTLVLALPVGAQFPLAGAAGTGDPATVGARLFTADLAGAALGALLVSTLLIPLLGVTAVCLLTAGLNAGAAMLALSVATRP